MTQLFYINTQGDLTQVQSKLGTETRMLSWRTGALVFSNKTADEIRDAFASDPIPVDREAFLRLEKDPVVLDFIENKREVRQEPVQRNEPIVEEAHPAEQPKRRSLFGHHSKKVA